MNLNIDKIKKIKIEEVSTEHSGDRVCLDLNNNLEENEGLLVGNYNRGLFLINNERAIEDQEYNIEARPFRVNAGVVSAYVYMPDGSTKYLCELRTGNKVLVTNPEGNTRIVEVTRLKIETRPMTLIKGTSTYDKKIAIESEGDINYFKKYREIFRWYDTNTKRQILLSNLKNYFNQPLHIKMEVSTFVQTAETVRLIEANSKKPIAITSLEPDMEVFAFITNPTLRGRHFGIIYDGFCLEV